MERVLGYLSEVDNVRLGLLASAAEWTEYAQVIPTRLSTCDRFAFGLPRRFQQVGWLAARWPQAEVYWPDCDVVWCPAESYVPTKKAKLVVTIHDLAQFDHERVHGQPIDKLTAMKWDWLFMVLSRNADAVHTVSNFTADQIETKFPSFSGRIHVVPNPVHERFFGVPTPEGGEVISRLGLRLVEYVLVPGGLSFRKNANLIARTWPLVQKERPGTRLVVAGQSESGWALRLKATDGDVILAGFVPDEELHALYCNARVVWFPSHYEGFGIPVLEAMACGTPVVASSAAAVPEVAGNAALLAGSSDAGQHADYLLAMLKDTGLRENYAAGGRHRASNFRDTVVGAQFLSTIHSLW